MESSSGVVSTQRSCSGSEGRPKITANWLVFLERKYAVEVSLFSYTVQHKGRFSKQSPDVIQTISHLLHHLFANPLNLSTGERSTNASMLFLGE